MHRNIRLAGIIAAMLLAGGCNESTDYDFDNSIETAKTHYAQQVAKDTANAKAVFAPASGFIPSASDLLFNGSTDGTLNIPVKESMSDGQKALIDQLNTLDGFSTVNPVTTTFSAPIDETTLKLGQTLHVLQLTTDAQGNVTGVAKAITSPAEMVVKLIDVNKTKLALIPTAPLQPGTKYFVILTSGIKSTSGDPIKPDTTYALLKGETELKGDFARLERLRQITRSLEGLAQTAGIDKSTIVLSWTFTTQSMGKALAALAEAKKASTILAQNTGQTTQTLLDPKKKNPAITGAADLYAGFIKLPYYLQVPGGANDPAALSGSWQIDAATGLPKKNADVDAPVLISVPNAASGHATAPADGWPVVIFQHGITADRTSLLGIAETLAKAGFVGVAIDMPLHGIDAESPFAGSALDAKTKERLFALDLVDNASGDKTPDGKVDDSGKYFINLESLLTGRDNVRQAVADLMVLKESLDSLDPVVPVDESKIRFVGHSLGGMVGTLFLAFEDDVGAATLAMPGGGIANLLRASPAFGPVINAGLEAKGILPGTEEYTTFFGAAQWVIDPADPINHGKTAAAKHNIHLLEVVGGAGAPGDQVIPNSVADAPLSGTDPLVRVMGLTQATTSEADAAGLDVVVKFNSGGHSSILKPDPDATALAVTVEMQTQTAGFMVTNGTALQITDSSVIAQ